MAFMMGRPIGLRESGILPEFFIGFFYKDPGFALGLAGLSFIRNYMNYFKLLKRKI